MLIHELTEMVLCIDRGVTFKAVDRFDMEFEGAGEPGDDPKAPYHREHRLEPTGRSTKLVFSSLPDERSTKGGTAGLLPIRQTD